MFGGNDCIGNEIIIDNLIYTVVGVLNDKDEDNKNVYIPITLLKQSPNAFVSLLSSDISEEYIKAQYRNLGITTEHYDFVNLNALISMIKEKGILSCILLITIMLIFLVKWAISRGIKQYEIINKLLKKII
ncbi:MAG: ABC transporter permease [Epulopiscium sp.]|nr:ABC transporter permease [Candidatus Epulonipiscium sp.]